MRGLKLQSTIEFLTTYTWAFTIVAIFIALLVTVVAFKSPVSYTPASCYITPTLQCEEALLEVEGGNSNFILVFLNNLGSPMSFPTTNSISVSVGFSNTTYGGNCYPANAPVGATIICTDLLAGYSSTVGGQTNPEFEVYYHLCTATSCPNTVYSTSGFASGTVSPYRANVIDQVTLLASNSFGKITLGGITYPSNTVLYLLNGVRVSLYAVPPAGHTFSSWSTTGSVSVDSSTGQSTNTLANGAGTVNAIFT